MKFTPENFKLHPPAVLLFRGRGLLSALIRWQTRSEYSHAAILMRDGLIVESWPGKGVQIKRLKDWAGVTKFDLAGMTDNQWDKAIDFAKAQVGKKYDWRGVLCFLSRTKRKKDATHWFCSDMVFAAVQHAGTRLLARTHAVNVSPALLGVSPLMLVQKLN
jgi:uncharacterized protein YycO